MKINKDIIISNIINTKFKFTSEFINKTTNEFDITWYIIEINKLFVFWYIFILIYPIINAYIIVVKEECKKANNKVVNNIEIFSLLNF